ncbi:MAG: MFS transporter [SAR202 cluster bacterium]|nr:MFS transporter [SAR202 cluster bacterium]
MDQRTLTPPTTATSAPEKKPPRYSPSRYAMFESLQYRDFRWIWAGSFISFLAMNMQMITRGWLVVELRDASPFALALVMVTFAVPSTISSLIGGALADRISKKYLVITSQTGNFLMTLLLGLLTISGYIEFWHVMAVGVVNGTMMGINMPSRAAMVSEVVPEHSLMNAISLNNSGMNLTRIIGPALAGFLILYMGIGGVFLLVAGIYVLAAASILVVNTKAISSNAPRKGVAGDIKEGFAYAIANPKLLGLVIIVLIATLFGFSYWSLLPAWAVEALNVKSDGLGILMTIMGVGALVGTLGLAGVSKTKHKGVILLGSAFVWGISLALFAYVTNYTIAIPFLLTMGAVSSIFMSMNMTLMQTMAAPEMRGRMMSLGMMTFGLMPISSLPLGALAEYRNSTADALFVSGLLLTLGTVIFLFVYPAFRKIE